MKKTENNQKYTKALQKISRIKKKKSDCKIGKGNVHMRRLNLMIKKNIIIANSKLNLKFRKIYG